MRIIKYILIILVLTAVSGLSQSRWYYNLSTSTSANVDTITFTSQLKSSSDTSTIKYKARSIVIKFYGNSNDTLKYRTARDGFVHDIGYIIGKGQVNLNNVSFPYDTLYLQSDSGKKRLVWACYNGDCIFDDNQLLDNIESTLNQINNRDATPFIKSWSSNSTSATAWDTLTFLHYTNTDTTAFNSQKTFVLNDGVSTDTLWIHKGDDTPSKTSPNTIILTGGEGFTFYKSRATIHTIANGTVKRRIYAEGR